MKPTTILAALAAAAVAALASAAPASAADTTSIPVEFSVENVNRSALPCSSDGRAYTVRGRIVGPRALLADRSRAGLAATLYLHEFSFGSFFWSFGGDPAFDWTARIADAGHVSVVIDRLGYDASDRPAAGTGTCIGAQADMARQVLAKLRSGDYSADGGAPPRFERLVLAGHSVGGVAAELAAHSFPDLGADALVLFAVADQGFTRRTVEQSFAQGRVCASGGDPADPGYAYFGETEREFQENVFHSATPGSRSRGYRDAQSRPLR